MAYKGKTTCRILKDIRRQIAEANDIDLMIKECTYQGDCAGTCPRCEAEVAYLERELARREAMGKVVRITGLAAATFAAAACSLKPQQQTIKPEEINLVFDGDPELERCGGIELEFEGEEPLSYPSVDWEVEDGVDDEAVFLVVETMPSFPGGRDSLFRFIADNIQYPKEAVEQHLRGRAIVQFVVSKTGEIVDVEVVRSAGAEVLDKEAIRVIRSMPKWIPGNQRGTAVNVQFTVPVTFKLAD